MSAPDLERIYGAAVAAVEPRAAVSRVLAVDDGRLVVGDSACDLSGVGKIVVVGAGKAAAGMAAGVEQVLGARVDGGLVVVKDGYRGPLGRISQVEAGHPLPDERGLRATARLLDAVRATDERTLLVCVLSGGASALLVAPAPGICLEDKVRTTDLLLASGADIGEVNAVRKHLSAVKGGQLAAAAVPAPLVSLVISDVIGDRLDVIASGPTHPDGSTFAEAREILGRRGLLQRIPAVVRERLERGAFGLIPETPKPGDRVFRDVRHHIVASNRLALTAATAEAGVLGYETRLLSTEVQGEAREAARRLAGEVRRAAQGRTPGAPPLCLLAGGETTVTVSGPGRGDRNQEFALAFALEIEGVEGVTLLSAGTDGTDGPTDAAGAFADGGTAARARRAGLEPAACLEANDSHRFFDELGRRTAGPALFVTGPTGTNVMDLQAVIVRGEGSADDGRR